MANLTSVVISLDDGTTQTFNIAPATTPTQTIDVTPGESVDVVAEAAPEAPATPATDAPVA